MKTVHLIFNPVAGKGTAKAAFDKIQEWAKSQPNLNLVVHPTENEGHATIIAKDLTSGNEDVTILSLGGDGTLSEILNGIVNFDKTTLGILPFGSGNDFVKALKMKNHDPVKYVDAYINNPTEKIIDYLLLNDKYRAINEVGLGMSAEVIGYRNSMKRFKPETQYKIATVIKALFWKGFDYEIYVDKGQTPQHVKAMWYTMNNGTHVGSGMVTSLNSKVDDGYITVSYLNNFNRIKTLHVLSTCKKGNIDKLKNHTEFNCKEIDIVGNNMTVEFDGFLLEHQNKINVKVIPHKLKLLVIAGN